MTRHRLSEAANRARLDPLLDRDVAIANALSFVQACSPPSRNFVKRFVEALGNRGFVVDIVRQPESTHEVRAGQVVSQISAMLLDAPKPYEPEVEYDGEDFVYEWRGATEVRLLTYGKGASPPFFWEDSVQLPLVDIESGETFWVYRRNLKKVKDPRVGYCHNCNQNHVLDKTGWPICSPHAPHYAVMSTGCEGRCEVPGCGYPSESPIHRLL